MAPKKDYLTIREAARLLRIRARTLYSLARARKFPAMKIGDQWRISRAALDEWSRKGGEAPLLAAKAGRGKR